MWIYCIYISAADSSEKIKSQFHVGNMYVAFESELLHVEFWEYIVLIWITMHTLRKYAELPHIQAAEYCTLLQKNLYNIT
jgi:hypothetical protein